MHDILSYRKLEYTPYHVSNPSIPGIITDISDGARYEQFIKDAKLLDGCAEHIGLILNADGVPLFKSCGKIYL